jgi:glycosyltransferase involved in cell wall biosynthesis
MAGFPTKVSESISCGTPVICTDTSDLRQYIQNGYNGFVCEIENLVDVFSDVLKFTDTQIEKMSHNCCDNVFYYTVYQQAMREFLQ